MVMWRPRWRSEPIVQGDLTAVLLTLNKPPQHWQQYYRRKLCEALGDAPLIIVSRDPMDWQRPNTMYLQQRRPNGNVGERIHNIYRQLLRAAKLARTPYVAVLNDDCLYPAEHFNSFRPPLDKAAYNFSRWAINEWERDEPFYHYCPFPDDPMLIAPREWLVSHMEGVERFDGNSLDFLMERVVWYTTDPIVCFNHTRGLIGNKALLHKQPWPIRAFSIPKWGEAAATIQEWREED